MKGIMFGNYHSFNDFQLILASKTIGTPSPKTETIDIPGGDGVLDLTEFFGETKYNNRSLSFEFSSMVIPSEFMPLFSRVQNALHGKKMTIKLDDDPDWYYIGRISVSEWKADRNIGKLTIDCDCEPYKYKAQETVVTATLDGTMKGLQLVNGRKRAIPIIATSSPFTIYHEGNTYSVGTGTFMIPEIELKEGVNDVAVKGSGTITFTWQEGDL